MGHIWRQKNQFQIDVVSKYYKLFYNGYFFAVEYAKSRDGFIANRLYDSLEYDFDHRSLIRLIIISKNIGIHSIREAIQIRHRIALEYFLNVKIKS